MPFTISRARAKQLCLAGVILAGVLLVLPVRVTFGNDPLLRLRAFDPELEAPRIEANCGSALDSVGARAAGTRFVDVARADACRSAGRVRVATAFAVVGLLVVSGLLGLHTAGDKAADKAADNARDLGAPADRSSPPKADREVTVDEPERSGGIRAAPA